MEISDRPRRNASGMWAAIPSSPGKSRVRSS